MVEIDAVSMRTLDASLAVLSKEAIDDLRDPEKILRSRPLKTAARIVRAICLDKGINCSKDFVSVFSGKSSGEKLEVIWEIVKKVPLSGLAKE